MIRTKLATFTKSIVAGLLLIALLAYVPLPVQAAIVTTVAQKTGVAVHSNDKAAVDASNLAEGYIIVKYTGGKNVRIKVQITKKDGYTYNYDVNNKGNPEVLPLTEGDGTYSIGVFENVSGTRYSQAYMVSLEVKMRDPLLPFLYANQYVNFSVDSDVDVKAQELVVGENSTFGKLEKIYTFVTDTLTYDTVLAETVEPGYIPVVDDVLTKKTGICFDYAALMSAMLRLQGIPSKLCIGYAGTIYHAWIDVYTEEAGWIKNAVKFDGKKWTLMDPTFVSTSNSATAVQNFIGSGNSYNQKYVY